MNLTKAVLGVFTGVIITSCLSTIAHYYYGRFIEDDTSTLIGNTWFIAFLAALLYTAPIGGLAGAIIGLFQLNLIKSLILSFIIALFINFRQLEYWHYEFNSKTIYILCSSIIIALTNCAVISLITSQKTLK